MNRYKPTDAAIHCGSGVCKKAGTKHVHWYTCAGCSEKNHPNGEAHVCQGMHLSEMTSRGSETGKLWACSCECLIKWDQVRKPKRKKKT